VKRLVIITGCLCAVLFMWTLMGTNDVHSPIKVVITLGADA